MPLNSSYGSASIRGFGGRSFLKGKLGTESNPANNGKEIYAADNSSPTGVYWLKTPSGTPYQAHINMDYGGGWIRLNAGNLGPYTTPLSHSSAAPVNVNMISGGSTTAFQPLNGPVIQPYHTGCQGYNFRSIMNLNATTRTDLGITQTRFNVTITRSTSNVVCALVGDNLTDIVLINGTTNMLAVCNNTPNRYGDLNPSNFTFEAYGNITTANNPAIWWVWTACGSQYGMTIKMNDIWVR